MVISVDNRGKDVDLPLVSAGFFHKNTGLEKSEIKSRPPDKAVVFLRSLT